MRATGSLHPPGRLDSLFGWIPSGRKWVPSLRYLLRRERVLSAIPKPVKDRSLLEVGCGAGSLLIELNDWGYNCTGFESSAEALTLARESIAESTRDVDLRGGEDPDWIGRFDIVMALDVLEHVEDDRSALVRWSEWLHPDGKMVLSVPAHQSRWGSGDVWAGHYRRYGRQGLVDTLNAAGLAVESMECYGFPLANITEIAGEYHYRRRLRQRLSAGAGSRERANDLSGIERNAYRRVMPLMLSLPVRVGISISQWLQRRTIGTDWGSGYIVVARKA